MSNAETFELKLAGAILLLALAIGLFAGQPLGFALLGLAAYLASHLYRLLRLLGLIRRGVRIRPPHPPGWWGEIHRALEKAQTRGRKRKRSLSRFATRFREAAAAMPEGLIMLTRDERIEWSNTAARTLLGIHYPNDAGKRLRDILRYPFLDEYLSAANFTRTLDFPSPDGKGRVLSLAVVPFGEKKKNLLVVVRDITLVFNLNQTRKDFVANVSHELRTPLTVILGFAEGLVHADKLPAQQRPLMLIQEQSQRMRSIIEDFLALSRLEMEQRERSLALVPVPGMLRDLIDEARNLSGQMAHVFISAIDPDLGLLGTESELRSAFSNLIFNAVRHTPTRAQISVTWKFENGQASLSVRDTGAGFAARHIPRLTERFYRVDDGRSSESGGSGLGLAIVKHAVSAHGGELTIESKIGMGSTFRCRFPEGGFCFFRQP